MQDPIQHCPLYQSDKRALLGRKSPVGQTCCCHYQLETSSVPNIKFLVLTFCRLIPPSTKKNGKHVTTNRTSFDRRGWLVLLWYARANDDVRSFNRSLSLPGHHHHVVPLMDSKYYHTTICGSLKKVEERTTTPRSDHGVYKHGVRQNTVLLPYWHRRSSSRATPSCANPSSDVRSLGPPPKTTNMMTTATTVVVVHLLSTAGRYNNAGVPWPTIGSPIVWTADVLNQIVLVVVLVHHHHGRGVLAVASQQHPHHWIAITNSSPSSRRGRIEKRWYIVWRGVSGTSGQQNARKMSFRRIFNEIN
jgi:hypothetical protein